MSPLFTTAPFSTRKFLEHVPESITTTCFYILTQLVCNITKLLWFFLG